MFKVTKMSILVIIEENIDFIQNFQTLKISNLVICSKNFDFGQ